MLLFVRRFCSLKASHLISDFQVWFLGKFFLSLATSSGSVPPMWKSWWRIFSLTKLPYHNQLSWNAAIAECNQNKIRISFLWRLNFVTQNQKQAYYYKQLYKTYYKQLYKHVFVNLLILQKFSGEMTKQYWTGHLCCRTTPPPPLPHTRLN